MVNFAFEYMTVEMMANGLMSNGRIADGVMKGHGSPFRIKRLAGFGLLLIVAACALMGCGRSKLLQVEQLMESDIDAADSLIYSMDEPKCKRNRALYALLKTQIDYKQYRQALNDSTIRVSTDYYGKKIKDYHAAMAWYSLGCISAESGNESTAVEAYLTAIRLFPDTLVRYYSLAEQNISYIFINHKMDDEALPIIKSCRINAVRLGDSAAIAFCDYILANSLLYKADYNTAENMFLELKDNKWLSIDTKDFPLLQLSKISQFKDCDFTQSLTYVDSFLIRNNHQVPYGPAYSIKADAYYGLNIIDSAQLYYKLSLTEATDPYTVCDAYRRLSEIQSHKGNSDSAAYYAKEASAWMDTIASATDSGNLIKIIEKYSLDNYHPKRKGHTLYIIFTVISCLVVIIALSFHYRTDEKIEPRSVSDLAQSIELFKKSELYLRMYDVICNKKNISAKESNSIVNDFHESLTDLRRYIVSTSKQLTDLELDYCLFMLLRFKQKDFHKIFCISYSGSRNFKARIKEKVSESDFKVIFGDDSTPDK